VPIERHSYNANATTITDLNGRVYQCTGCTNQTGHPVETSAGSLTLPGETAAALQVTARTTMPVVVQTVVRDGVTWSYAYDNLHYSTRAGAYRYDQVIVTGPNAYRVESGSSSRESETLSFVVGCRRHTVIQSVSFHAIPAAGRPLRQIVPGRADASLAIRTLYRGA